MSSDDDDDVPKWKVEEICLIILVWVIFFIFIYSGIFKRIFRLIYRAITTRNQVQRRLQNGLNSNPSDSSLQFQSRGLELSMVQTLPMSKYKKNEGENKAIDVDCAICLGELEEGEWLKHLPNCAHRFHVLCMDTWFQSHSNCPLCVDLVYFVIMFLSTYEDFFSFAMKIWFF